ncbi:hypothetical protein [Pedobacter heparinus]|uniref:hypothetical protein n=1 Tax=Pedobacter heparinus TaxID=984 RepID=UPI00292F2AE1|nr:hypothetical protein [Pedobacter heparinus]
MINIEERQLNEITCDWYRLAELMKSTLTTSEAAEANARQQQTSKQLIPLLKEKQATKDNPFATCIEGDTFVNIWLDENGEIQDGGYYTKPAL